MADEYQERLSAALAKLTQAQREDFEERAGIMEFDGGLPRLEAERAAYKIASWAVVSDGG